MSHVFRAIFISDCHLGTPGCQDAALLEFLRCTESDYLYLVGDIIDGWQLRRRWYWHQLHNDVIQKVLRKVRYWSLSQFLKFKVKKAVRFITAFEEALAREARTRGFDGVVCGHIQHAEIRTIDEILYCNSGDWVESLTALVEAQDGTLQIVRWPQMLAAASIATAAAPSPAAVTWRPGHP